VKTFTEMLNQHGEVVMTMRGLGMFRAPAVHLMRAVALGALLLLLLSPAATAAGARSSSRRSTASTV